MWSRIHLIPLLTAEEDRDLVRRHLADQAREKELLGSETSPYNSDRYVGFCSWDGIEDGKEELDYEGKANVQVTDTFDQHTPSHRTTLRNRPLHKCTEIGKRWLGHYIVHKAQGYQTLKDRQDTINPRPFLPIHWELIHRPPQIAPNHIPAFHHLYDLLIIPYIHS